MYAFPPKKLLKPKYWPIWLLFGLLRAFALLPYSIAIKLGAALGYLLGLLPLEIKHCTNVNLALCFPELSLENREILLKKNFISVGIGVIETAFAWFASPKKLAHLGHFEGVDQLHAALSTGKGAILISPHLTTLQIAGRLSCFKQPFAVVYREQKNPVVNYIMERRLKQYYLNTIPKGNLREILRCLKNNIPIWYTPDIDAGLKNSIFVPFFGVPAATITATTRLAKKSDAAVIPIFFYRRENGSGYDIIVKPRLENFPTNDLTKDTQTINKILEDGIREKPEQYIWQYKRFKTRPAGEKRFYK
jgi:Kdo2-lipid IVA lauroyltransferase/acyltransferase